MNMIIVGSGVANAPTPSSGSSSHSAAAVAATATAVGQPPPAHLTQLTSAPVIGLGGQQQHSAAPSTSVPISLRTTVEHTISSGGDQGGQAYPQPALVSSPINTRLAAPTNNVISHALLPSHSPAHTALAYGGNASQQQMSQQVLSHQSNNPNSSSINSSGNHGSQTGGSTITYGHSLPPALQRPVSNRPLQSPSNRSMTNGLPTRVTPPSRPSGLSGRPLNSGAPRSYSASRVASAASNSNIGGGVMQGNPNSNSAAHHLMSQAPPTREQVAYSPSPRNMPMSPHRSNSRPRQLSASRQQTQPSQPPSKHSGSSYGGSSSATGSSNPGGNSLPILGPSAALHYVSSQVNSPSLIPQQVPQFMPNLGVLHMGAAGPSSPQYRMGSPLPTDNSIFPPNEIKKITKVALGNDDDFEGHDYHHNTGRRALMSPRNPQRRSLFNNAALQDHNYCAVPPPSPQPPPRSPTPPLSPYISVPGGHHVMGASAQSQQPTAGHPDLQHHSHHQQQAQHGGQPHHQSHHQYQHQHESFSFGIAGYKDSSAVLKDAAAASSVVGGLDKNHPHNHQYGANPRGNSGSNHHYSHHQSSSAATAAGANGGGRDGSSHNYLGTSPSANSTAGNVASSNKESGNKSMVGGYPSPHYSGGSGSCPVADGSPLSRLNKTIEDAGVGPMTPLGHERSSLHGDKSLDADDSPDSRPSPDRDGGEETETAPEEDPADDAITRCICDYLHDDGYMICCDKCSVWQHVVCMFIDKDNIPEEYLCEKCQPRAVDKKRAKALQKAREKEIFKTLPIDSSDDESRAERTKLPASATTNALPHTKGRKASGSTLSSKKLSLATTTAGAGSTFKRGGSAGLSHGPGLGDKKAEKKLNKKPVKRRTLKETLQQGLKSEHSRKSSPRKNQRRKSASATDIETEEENVNDASALRSWIDTYEEAVTNHYSPELRARLQGVKLPNTQFKPKDVNHSSRYNVSLRGNGMKVLTANSYIPANTPIIECRGKYMLASQLNSRAARNSEYVLFHRISPDLEVCVDCKTYGNDSRFCRRSNESSSDATKFNAEVKHHLDKGSLHLYIVSTRTIDKNQEILLCPLEKKSSTSFPSEPQLSIQDELRQIKKVNGLLNDDKRLVQRKTPSNSVKQQRRMKREVKKEMCDSSSDEDIPVRKTRSNNVEKQAAAEKTVNFNLNNTITPVNVKKEIKEEVAIKEEKEVKSEDRKKSVKSEPIDSSAASKADKVKQPLKIDIKEEEKYSSDKDAKDSPVSAAKSDAAATTPTSAAAVEAAAAAAKSPSKQTLGLPDQTGLIVGVNTINYDVSLRNKAMSREEKKMEMILKAIAAMEKAESRKKHESGSGAGGSTGDSSERAPAKRRRSNSSKKEHADSNIESSCDETGLDTPRSERPRAPKGKRKRTISLRRRSRAKSGDSTSAMSADESGTTPNMENESSTPGDGAPFKFPFKKHHDGDDIDDDVSGHYIRGSKSPPGIANHLLRSAVTNTAGIKSPTKSIGCSAKKRWLRAAMSEDHTEDAAAAGGASSSPAALTASSSPAAMTGSSAAAGSSPSQEPDYTPLKKRRLATYNESHDEQGRKHDKEHQEEKTSKEQVSEKIKSLPNGLKKRLISNLLLKSVLDKAMEDILPEDDTDGGGSVSPVQQSNDEQAVSKDDSQPLQKQNQQPPVQSRTEDSAPSIEEDISPTKKKTRSVRKGGAKNKKPEEPTVQANGIEEEQNKTDDDVTVAATDAAKTSAVTEHHKPNNVNTPEATEENTKSKTGDNQKTVSQTKIVSDEVKKSSASAATTTQSVLDAASRSSAVTAPADEKPPTPIQHSVFKSFFSTDLSIDDIDRQIEAKRIELARENSLVSSCPSPRLDFSTDDLPRSLRTETTPKHQWSPVSTPSVTSNLSQQTTGTSATPNNKSSTLTNSTPTTARKKVSIADYKKRKQSTASHGENQTDSSSGIFGGSMSSLLASAKYSSLPSVTLPDVPGLEPASRNNKTAKTGGSLFEPKRTRSNSPLHEKRNSADRSNKGLTPQESRRQRSGSPLDKRSPAKGGRVDRTSSPRRGTYHSSSQKHERWESRSSKERESYKGKPNSPLIPSKRVPVPCGVPGATVSDYPSTVVTTAAVSVHQPPIHTPDMPREDLTERLRKEFGLNIEDSDGEDGSDSETSGGNGNGGGSDYPALRRHNGPERTNGWREEENSGSGFWGQR